MSDQLLTTDFIDTYVLGIKLISNGLYDSAKNCIDLLVMDRNGFPDHEPILTEYIVTLEYCLKEKLGGD
jgi:hypothetical protein